MNVLSLGYEMSGRWLQVSASPWPMVGVTWDRDDNERELVLYLLFVSVVLWWWKGALLHRLPDDEPTAQSGEQAGR